MNGLEALEKGFWKLTHKGNINYYNIIEKELKALEIIKKSISDVTSLDLLLRELLLQRKITPDELGLLMEVLK